MELTFAGKWEMRYFVRVGIAVLAAFGFGSAGAQQLTTSFDDITTLAGAGWVFTNNSTAGGSVNWFQGNTSVFSAQAGAGNSYLAANFNAASFGGDISLWAMTPTLSNLQNGEVLTFYTRTEPSAPAADRLEVRLSTNGSSSNVGATTTSVGDFTTLLLTVNPTFPAVAYPGAWTQFTATLAGLPVSPTTGRIAFRYFVTDTSTHGDYIGIDTVNLTSIAAPNLTITKTHGANFSQGQVGATYTITAGNSGAGSTAGTITVSDTVPAGLTPVTAAGGGWTCPIVAQLVTCTRNDTLAGGLNYPAITLTVDVAKSAPALITNSASVAGSGQSNSASDPTAVTQHVLDIDANGSYDALTDGLLIVRYLSGVTGTALTGGALGAGATRSTPAAIASYLDGIKAQLNVDGNAQSDALTDGLMLIRYLFGLRGAALIDGTLGTGATRLTAADIETYIQSLMP